MPRSGAYVNPLVAIASAERRTIVRYVWWLTLSCGHRVRIAGPTRPKARARCFECGEAARASVARFFAGCTTCSGDRLAPKMVSPRRLPRGEAADDVTLHLAEHPGHDVGVWQ